MNQLPQSFDDCVALAQALVRAETMTPANGEHALLEQIAAGLRKSGFTVDLDPYDPAMPGRCSLVAQLNPDDRAPALLFGGHIDTVQLGLNPWKGEPFGGVISDGKLYGRGSCDMKSGVAAYLCAAARLAPELGNRNLVLHIYGGEEAGCLGSFHVVQHEDYIRNIGAAVIGEPSGAIPLVGHKGALWLKLEAQGRTAHASMPEHGDNALGKLLPGANRLLGYLPEASHPAMGKCSSVLSTLHAGLNTNSVPDHALLTIDMRTVPGQDHRAIRAKVQELAGPDINITTTLDIPPVWTDPENAWIRRIFDRLTPAYGKRPEVVTVQFFTDAAALRTKLTDIPLIVLGPGDPALAHQTDETCDVEQIRFVEQVYEIIIRDWYGLN